MIARSHTITTSAHETSFDMPEINPSVTTVESIPNPSSPEPAEAKRQRAVQNKKITNYVNEADTFLTTLLGDATLKSVAAAHGFDETELAAGVALADEAGRGLQGRQAGMGEKKNEQEELETNEEKARSDYAAFRLIARASYPAEGDRLALGLTGDVPEDVDSFITTATTGYTNAATTSYTEKMTKRNYAPVRLTELLAQLNELTGDLSDRDTASGDAVEDTKTRDKAYADLRDWMKELKGVMRGALKGQQAQLAKLKL